ncbi:LTA synthase family protein [Burkholderia metallica]|uniref:LTA synthase family protein n=1 Tax=Burkholderia metallica TaxID=488729 RepID=UPI001CF2A37C|nr:LTA synthase family protein [Burkholderia metallica]MCA7998068.1 LTA synthase family protein [Burkholderia metallica]
MASILPTFACAAVLSFATDALPRAGWRRAPRALALHVVSVVFVACLICALTRRPVFSAFISLGLVGLMSGVSNAKFASLREPFVFTDLSLFSQLFAHPRLYLPFLSMQTVAAIVVGVVMLAGGFFLDTPAPGGVAGYCAVAAMTLMIAGYALAANFPLTLDLLEDQRRHGFFTVFIAYLLNGMRRATFRSFERAIAASPFACAPTLTSYPDVIVIQSESFFDARMPGAGVNPTLYAHFEAAIRESSAYGKLDVPAWGANTMRSEFAFLSGVASSALGYARFYPYVFVRRACASLASWFRRAGYETVAIHPYYADFFARNRVFPLLGFDDFLDIEYFIDSPRAGPYVADSAVLDAVISALDARRDKPLFVFAMTMENHGPLHLEQVLPGESYSRHTLGEDASWRDLTAYLRHIENADAMIGRLLDYLRTSDRETVVCFYGDHVPALPHVFEKLGVIPQTSDYFIWRNYGTDTPECRNLAAEELGSVLLRVVQDHGNRTEQPCASEKAT